MRLVTPKDLPGRYSGVASDVISTFTTSTPCVGASGDGTITSRRTPARTVLAPACVCVMVVVVVGGGGWEGGQVWQGGWKQGYQSSTRIDLPDQTVYGHGKRHMLGERNRAAHPALGRQGM
jgi:hypothetical protein